jgi:hypothetical protein
MQNQIHASRVLPLLLAFASGGPLGCGRTAIFSTLGRDTGTTQTSSAADGALASDGALPDIGLDDGAIPDVPWSDFDGPILGFDGAWGFDGAAPDGSADGGRFRRDGGFFGDGGAGSCGELAACCAELPAALVGQCMNVAQSGRMRRCQALLNQEQAQGYCGGVMLPDGGTPLGPECTALLACCAQAPGPLQARCDMTAEAGNEAQCQQVLTIAGQFCMAPPTDGGTMLGPECTALLACCGQVPPQLQAQCDGVAQGGNEAQCQQGLNLAGGFCMAPPSDGGTTMLGPECTALLACCAQVPPQFQPQCDGVAQGGNEAQCQQGLNLAGRFCMAPPTDGGIVLGPECSALLSCCGQAPPAIQPQCISAAQSGNEAQCGQYLMLAGNLCAPPALDGGPSADAGPRRDAGPLGPECSSLLSCCAQVPPQFQTQCDNVAQGGSEQQCQQALNLAGNFCGPTAVDAGPVPMLGPECMALLSCCPAVPAQFQMQCFAAAQSGNEGQCQQDLQLAGGLCPAPVLDAGVGPAD